MSARVLVVFRVGQRATRFAMSKPAREILFTSVPREAKYKAKNFIDTVLYRGSDAVSGFLFDGLLRVGLGLSGLAWVMVPVLMWVGSRLFALVVCEWQDLLAKNKPSRRVCAAVPVHLGRSRMHCVILPPRSQLGNVVRT